MLELKNISKSFHQKKALDNISFKVETGNIFGIIGPNGAGKTTILRIILDILQPTSGIVNYYGRKTDTRFKNITGYLPEERGLYPKSSVFDTLNYFTKLKGYSSKAAKKLISHWLERLDLDEYKKWNIENLSKGNQQKVQFIGAIVHNPKVLVLDEPFSGFDPVNQKIFTDLILELRKDRIIILSTHIMDLVENLCDNIFMINSGKKVFAGKTNELIKNSKSELYKVEFGNENDALNFSKNHNVKEIINSTVKLELTAADRNLFLQNIMQKYSVKGFDEVKPSLHEIFIQLVNENEH